MQSLAIRMIDIKKRVNNWSFFKSSDKQCRLKIELFVLLKLIYGYPTLPKTLYIRRVHIYQLSDFFVYCLLCSHYLPNDVGISQYRIDMYRFSSIDRASNPGHQTWQKTFKAIF